MSDKTPFKIYSTAGVEFSTTAADEADLISKAEKKFGKGNFAYVKHGNLTVWKDGGLTPEIEEVFGDEAI